MVRWFDRLLGRVHDGDAPRRLPSPDELVCVALPQGEPEALMLQELLRNAGVHSIVKNRFAYPVTMMQPIGTHELFVLRRDLKRAEAALHGAASHGDLT
jgi:hypothetical protein